LIKKIEKNNEEKNKKELLELSNNIFGKIPETEVLLNENK
jgi:hypothetical protein